MVCCMGDGQDRCNCANPPYRLQDSLAFYPVIRSNYLALLPGTRLLQQQDLFLETGNE